VLFLAWPHTVPLGRRHGRRQRPGAPGASCQVKDTAVLRAGVTVPHTCRMVSAQKSATARERNAEKARKAKGGDSQSKKNAAAMSYIVRPP